MRLNKNNLAPLVVLPLLFSGCVDVTTLNEDAATGDYEAHLKEHGEELVNWVSEIQNIKNLGAYDNSLMDGKDELNFDFSPVRGTHTKSATVSESFNSIYLSQYDLGEKMQANMSANFFECATFQVVNHLIDGEEIKYLDGIPPQKDDRFPNTAIAYMEAALQVKYIFLVDVSTYKPGNVRAATELLSPGEMQGRYFIYDILENKLLEESDFYIDGFEELGWSYDQNGPNDSQQKNADKALDDKNKEFYPTVLIDLIAPDNNWTP